MREILLIITALVIYDVMKYFASYLIDAFAESIEKDRKPKRRSKFKERLDEAMKNE